VRVNDLNQSELKLLIDNNNTGIEFEYAVGLALMNEDDSKDFINKIIEKHRKSKKIIQISENIKNELKNINWFDDCKEIDYVDITATQNDNVGPSDIIIKNKNNNILGLSIKYDNNCTLNFSSKLFFDDNNILIDINKVKLISCKEYIKEMQKKYGQAKYWFRKRKSSAETDRFIDFIRGKVIDSWNNKTNLEKKKILESLVHANSPIDFCVIKVNKDLTIDIDFNPIKDWDPDKIDIKRYQTSYVGLFYKNKLIGKIQVKFNNGILEKGKNTNYDHCIDGIYMKNGQPLSSWNFSL